MPYEVVPHPGVDHDHDRRSSGRCDGGGHSTQGRVRAGGGGYGGMKMIHGTRCRLIYGDPGHMYMRVCVFWEDGTPGGYDTRHPMLRSPIFGDLGYICRCV